MSNELWKKARSEFLTVIIMLQERGLVVCWSATDPRLTGHHQPVAIRNKLHMIDKWPVATNIALCWIHILSYIFLWSGKGLEKWRGVNIATRDSFIGSLNSFLLYKSMPSNFFLFPNYLFTSVLIQLIKHSLRRWTLAN